MTDLLSALWRASFQGGVALTVIALLTLTLRRLSPNLTCWLWRLGLLKCASALVVAATIALPLLPAPPIAQEGLASPRFESVSAPAIPPLRALEPSESVVKGEPNAPQDATPRAPAAVSVLSLVPALYLLGLALCLIRLAFTAVRTALLLHRALPAEHSALPTLTARFGLRHAPRLARSRELTSPLLAFQTILLPAEACDDEPLILAHELAHLKRHDLAWELALSLIQALFWFHPLVWWAKREESLAREQAADALALAVTPLPPADYARALLNASLQRSNSASLLAVGAITRGSRLRRRLSALAQPRLPQRQAVALGTLASVIALCAFVPWKAVARQVPARPTPPPQTISGFVRRQDGQPIAYAQVRLVRYTGSDFRRIEGKLVMAPPTAEVVAQTKTAADGTYRFSGTYSDYRLHILIDAPGFAPTDRLASGGRATLEPALRWEAVVVDAQGRPLAGKKITAVGISNARRTLNPKLYEGLTNSQGRFTVESGERPGSSNTVLFSVDANPLVIASMTPSETQSTLIQRLVLVPGRTISGQIIDTKGNPLPQARLSLRSYNHLRFPFSQFPSEFLGCQTDAKGNFTSPLLPPGDYQLDITSADKALSPLHVRKLTLGNKNLTNLKLTLTPGVTVRGKVTDRRTGKPFSKLVLYVSRDWEILENGKPSHSGLSVSYPVQLTDPKGNYELHLPVETPCRLRIEERQGPTSHTQLSRRFPDQLSRMVVGKEGEVRTVNFTPTYARPLVGEAVDVTGKPIAGARVNDSTTDAQGRFSIPEERLRFEETGTVTLSGSKDDLRGSVVVDAKSAAPVRLVLKAGQWITLRGTLVDQEGKLPPRVKLDATTWGKRGPGPKPQVTVDAAGNFTLRVEPSYRIQLIGTAPGLGRVLQSLPDNLAPGTTKNLGRLVFRAAPDSIAGRVVDAQGKPVTRGLIGVFGPHSLGTAPLDSQGRFELKGLVPGDKLIVSIQAAPGKPAAHRFNIPHNRRDLVFHLGGSDPYTDRKRMQLP